MGLTNVLPLFIVVLGAAHAAPSSLSEGSADCQNNPNKLYPHPTSCNHFLQCVHGTPVQMPCAPGTEFNFLYQTCVFPWQSDCKVNQNEEEPASEPAQQEDITESSSEPSAESTTEASVPTEESDEASTPEPETDAGRNSDSHLPSNPADSGSEVNEEVPPEIPEEEAKEGENQDPQSKEENHDHKEDHNNSNDAELPPEIPEDENKDQPSKEEKDDQEEDHNDNSNDDEFDPTSVCLTDPGSFFITPDLNDCTAYIICTFGEAYYGKCQEGKYFSPVFTTCSSDNSAC